MMTFALIVALASSIYLADMPNPKYEPGVRRLDKRCGHLETHRVEELKKLAAQLHSSGKTRRRTKDACRAHCEEWPTDFRTCTNAIVALQFTPATIPRPPVKKPVQFSPKLAQSLARGDRHLERLIGRAQMRVIQLRKDLQEKRTALGSASEKYDKKHLTKKVRRYQARVNQAEQKILDLKGKFGRYPATLPLSRDARETAGVLRNVKLSVLEREDKRR